MYYHVDGELVPAEEATVSVDDRGFLYGDAAFETMRAYGGDVFEWEAHAARLRRTCESLGMDHGLSDADLRDRVDETPAANGLAEAYVRLSVTRGVQPGTLDPRPEVDPTVVVIVKELPRGGVDGSSTWSRPARVRIVETRRVPDEAIPAAAKTHNFLNGILARLELRGTEADEAALLDADGNLAEGATSNLFLVRDGTLHTPSLDGPVLPGITRRVVMDLAEEAGVPTETGQYDPGEMAEADEAFLTNSTSEIRPIATVDGSPVGAVGDGPDGCGAGPVTETLARRYAELVEERHY